MTYQVEFRFNKNGQQKVYHFHASAEEYILYAAQDAGIDLPHACEQGWCLACASRLLSGRVSHEDAYLYYPQDEQAGFVLLCSSKPESDLVLYHDYHQTRRDMVQHRLDHSLLTRTYPKAKFRRGRAQK